MMVPTPINMCLLSLLLGSWISLIVADPDLIVATRNNISQVSLEDMKVLPLVGNTSGSMGVDYDLQQKVLYWSETLDPRIMSLSLSGPNNSREVIVDRGEDSTPDGIAFDWVHGNLYWTDATLDTIEVINLETRLRKALINENLGEARAIVVDPRDDHGPYMYWTDLGTVPKIEKAGLDGSNRKQIVAENIQWPNGLAIDFTQNRIYWIDSKLRYVGSATLDGTGQRVLFRTNIQHQIYAMDLFQEYMYYSEWNTKAVYRVNKQSRNGTVVVRRDTSVPNGIRVVDALKQPAATNRCHRVECPASALCLPSPSLSWKQGHTCVCPDNPPDSSPPCVPGPGVLRTTTTGSQTTHKTSTVKPSSGGSRRGLEWNVGVLSVIMMGYLEVCSY